MEETSGNNILPCGKSKPCFRQSGARLQFHRSVILQNGAQHKYESFFALDRPFDGAYRERIVGSTSVQGERGQAQDRDRSGFKVPSTTENWSACYLAGLGYFGGMDCLASDAKRRHDYFLKMVNKRNSELRNVHRIILIGTGESGKSTFVKQMKLLSSQNQTFPDGYRVKFIPEIQRNLVQALHFILAFLDSEEVKLGNERLRKAQKAINNIKTEIDRLPDAITHFAGNPNPDARKDFYDTCSLLWDEPIVKETALRGNEFQLIDCAQYFLDRIDEIANPAYKPSDEDVLQCRTKTLGIHTESIIYNNVNFELVDVGGQREQRAKWIEAMSDGITAVIFLTDVSSYDMMLAEDTSVNRLREAISLLSQVWTKNPLRDKSIILFLNKQDRLENKVRSKRTSIEDFFPEFRVGKTKYLIDLLRDIKSAQQKRNKKENDVWDKHFAYFLPSGAQTGGGGGRDGGKSGGPAREEAAGKQLRDGEIMNEYSQIQSLLLKVINENSLNQWDLESSDKEVLAKDLMARDDFAGLQRRLMAVPLFQLVTITNFIQD
ncbi:unnamed protein product, partial [Protopolystoma xenopodis]